MNKTYPLVEAIFELRWGERSPDHFKFSKSGVDVYLQKLAVNASDSGYKHVETPNEGTPLLPHVIKYRYRKEKDVWPCIQSGLGIFTINQVLAGYEKNIFLRDIEESITIWMKSLGEQLGSVTDTLRVCLRYQNAFFEYRDDTAIARLEKVLGINLKFPNQFDSTVGSFDNITMKIGISCEDPKNSHANLLIADAVIEGRAGLLIETSIESKYSDIVSGELDIKEQVEGWIEKAYGFHKNTYKTLMNG